jgi:hypothetical protein
MLAKNRILQTFGSIRPFFGLKYFAAKADKSGDDPEKNDGDANKDPQQPN